VKVVLDTNFFVLHYFSKDDASTKTRLMLTQCRKIGNKGLIPTIVLGEFYAISQKMAGRDAAERVYAEIISSGLSIVEITSDIAKQAGVFRLRYKEDIPWGDCIIAATAFLHGADYVVTEDPHFKTITEVRARTLKELRF